MREAKSGLGQRGRRRRCGHSGVERFAPRGEGRLIVDLKGLGVKYEERTVSTFCCALSLVSVLSFSFQHFRPFPLSILFLSCVLFLIFSSFSFFFFRAFCSYPRVYFLFSVFVTLYAIFFHFFEFSFLSAPPSGS